MDNKSKQVDAIKDESKVHQSSKMANEDNETNGDARSYSSFSDASIDYAPSPNTCAFALTRANQIKIQTLLRQVIEQTGHDRLDTLRLLRKVLKEVDYHLAWLSQLDFFETIDRILQDDNWRVVNDCTLLLIDAIPRLQFDIDPPTITQIFSNIIPNLGHKQSDVRRSTLLLLNMYINQHMNHFQHTLKLLIDHGFTNYNNFNAQKGCILSLPLLLTDKVVQNQDLMPLMSCLCELLVNSDTHLFYPLFLAMQRLHNIIGDRRFKFYLRKCHPEASILYNQAASRSNSVSSAAEIQSVIKCRNSVPNLSCKDLPIDSFEKGSQVKGSRRLSRSSISSHEGAAEHHQNDNDASSPTRRSSIKHVHNVDNIDKDGSSAHPNAANIGHKNVTFDKEDLKSPSIVGKKEKSTEHTSKQPGGVQTSQAIEETHVKSENKPIVSAVSKQTSSLSSQSSITSLSSGPSLASSQALLVDPSRYMHASALSGQTIYYDKQPTYLNRQPTNPSCNELKFGIFPRQLILSALGNKYPDKLESLQQMMIIMRESPINHLAILMTYFDSFMDQFLMRLMDSGDYKVELIGIDMIETIVVKTKVSTMSYIRPMVNLLIKGLGDQRAIFRENTMRVIHKIMTYLPPQQVIDAIFEHKHSKNASIREESINRITAAVLNFDKNEFNLTKLCYHVIPMLADQHRNVRMAALECLAVLAYALGPERIGSLLTAAEAVQTGCDYDGLLDAIHARLCRRALPRCNPDGSIRYMIKPLLSGSHNRESADVQWVLQVPTYQSKYSQPNLIHLRSSPSESEQSVEPSFHTSEDDFVETRNAIDITGRRRDVRQKSDPNILSDGQNLNKEASHRSKPEYSMSKDSNVECRKSRDNLITFDYGDLKHHQSSYPFHIKGSTRRNSQGSTSSASTSKELFRYYLQKFKQSLTDDAYLPASSVTPTALPSDAIIYTDSPVVLNDNVEFSSKLQQTSFDYDNEEEVGRIPSPTHIRTHRGSTSSLHFKEDTDLNKDHIENESVASSSKSTSPISVMERKISREKELRNETKEYAARRRSSTTSIKIQNRRFSSVQQPKGSSEIVSDNKAQTNQIREAVQLPQRRSSVKTNQQPSSIEINLQNNEIESVNNPDTRQSLYDEASYSAVPVSNRKVEIETTGKVQDTDSSENSTIIKSTELMDQSKLEESEQTEQRRPSSHMKKDEGQSNSSGEDNLTETLDEQEGSDHFQEKEQDRRNSTVSDRKPSLTGSISGAPKKTIEKEHSVEENESISSQSSATLIKTAMEISEQEHENSDEQSPKEYSEHGTQTTGDPAQKTKRRDSRQGRRQSAASKDRQESRRKASRSQPPPLDRTHSRQKLTTRDDYVPYAVPSPSIVASVNIRHILENVAQTEGPFQEPNIAFKVAMDAIEAPVWSTKVEGMLALIRLATFHQHLIVRELHDVICRTANETKNLRSTVARSAIFALGDFCVKLKRQVEPELDTIVQALLAKSVENTAFIRDDIRKAFNNMVEELTPWKLASSLIHHGSYHKNMHIRQMSSQFISMLVEKMGATKCMVGSKDISDQLIPAAGRFAMDSSPHTRFYGRKIFSVLLNHNSFERLMRKHCTPSMYRNTLGIIESIKRRGVGVLP